MATTIMTDQVISKKYELSALTVSEGGINELISLVVRHGGVVENQSAPKKIRLAYEINKHREAYFNVITFSAASADTVSKLSADLKFINEIIRFLIVSPVKESVALVRRSEAATPTSPSSSAPEAVAPGATPTAPAPELSNEALEKKLEEILQ